MRNRRVMIIDDDTILRECMCDALLMESYDVTQAENGQAALDKLGRFALCDLPDCIIVDLMMPVMGGEQFIERLNADVRPYLSNIPVIVATAQPRNEKTKGLRHVKKLLAKPLNISELYHAVEESLAIIH